VYKNGEPITFRAEATDDDNIVSYEWEYQFIHNAHYHPDIKTVTGQTYVETTLPDEGLETRSNLRVILRAKDSFGLVGTAQLSVLRPGWETSLGNKAPVLNFTVSGNIPRRVGQPIIFDAGSTYDPNMDYLTYEWSFGDGLTATSEGPDNMIAHTYDMYCPQGFTVELTVWDNWGASNSTSMVLYVDSDPLYTNTTCPPSATRISLTMPTENGECKGPTEPYYSSSNKLIVGLLISMAWLYTIN